MDNPRIVGKVSVSRELALEMHRAIVRIRRFEERVAEMVESKEIRCPCHLCIGQEAIPVGICANLTRDDYLWGGHRSHGHYLAKGGDLRTRMAEILGKVTGCSRGRGGSMHLFAPEVSILGTVPLVAATIPLAAGSALASKLRNDGRVSVAFFGDGATEEGHFHESLHLASVYRLPVLFVCENNLYSSHLPLLDRRREDNIHRSADAHAITGRRIDGNDALEVYEAAKDAVAQLRAGNGPVLLECRTYRWRGHVGASWDMDVGVRRRDELKDWLPKDPLGRLRDVLLRMGCSPEDFQKVEDEARLEIEEAVQFARKSPYPDVSELEEHVYWKAK